mgnify:CR=1 FL=1
MDMNVRIAGEAGQGVQTTGELLVGALAKMGFHVLSTQVYMSRIRGGLNSYDIRFGDAELHSARRKADILVALNEEALDTLAADVEAGGAVFFDGKAEKPYVGIGFTRAAKETGGSAVMANTVAAGAVFARLGYDVEALVQYLAVEFKKKGSDVVEKNAACARRGGQLAVEAGVAAVNAPKSVGAPGRVYSGTEAVGLSAALSGVKFVASYPMTPSTGVFTFLAGAADKYGIVVEQAEDEIAAINMVCGATYGGVVAMTTTSGGGFALMCEGLSLAGMHELPAFVFLSQRPGPATGLPTRTGQEDLQFAIRAGHGEFVRAVYAPGTIEECYELTRLGVETAHKYQTPVILLADQYLVDLRKNIPPLDETYKAIDRHIKEDAGEDYMRYAVTESGVSPRAVPGGSAFVVLDSDEHTADGHITENLDVRVEMVDKRLRKGRGLIEDVVPPARYGAEGAGHLIISWGSTYGPCREAVDILRTRGVEVEMLHFSQVWPINTEAVKKAVGKRSRVTVVEGNATGQFAGLLREAGAIGECEKILKYNGLAFAGEEIAEEVSK